MFTISQKYVFNVYQMTFQVKNSTFFSGEDSGTLHAEFQYRLYEGIYRSL